MWNNKVNRRMETGKQKKGCIKKINLTQLTFDTTP